MRLQQSFTAALLFGSITSASVLVSQECQRVCKSLSEEYPDQVFLKTETDYELSRHSYWSLVQGAYAPTCFFRPKSAEEVSRAVVILTTAQCKFAVKSGGHAPFKSSTIQDGLVVDLAELNDVVLSEDRQSALIGPAARWHEVYPILQEYNVSVPGGRQYGVGVGGLTLGGGVSFLSNLRGWTCDNVLEFEVVLADGSIVQANPTLHADLFWALRGGGSNFGIVTNFKFMVYEQGMLWASIMAFNYSSSRAIHDAYATWGRDGVETDPRSHALVWWNARKDSIPDVTVVLLSSDPSPAGTHPEVVDDFYEIGPISALEQNAFHGDIANAQRSNESATRNTFWTVSWAINAEMTHHVFEIWEEESRSVVAFTTRFRLELQTLTRAQMRLMRRNGGNPTGLADQQHALGFVNLVANWKNAEHDEVVYQTLQRIVDRVKAAAEQRGVSSEFIYTNYASPLQDPFVSFGAANHQRLLDIAKQYDPEGVFQSLVSSGQKLVRA